MRIKREREKEKGSYHEREGRKERLKLLYNGVQLKGTKEERKK